ncbi:MAG: hypothetical protein RBR71_04200 [Gudongella sp.]|nr:hypothetical protein [Gudongella sp.]
MLRVNEVKLALDRDEKEIPSLISKMLRIAESDIISWSINKKSIDARNKSNIYMVYSIDIKVNDEETLLKRNHKKGILKVNEDSIIYQNKTRTGLRPIIVGTGPAGLFCGLVLSELGFNPIIIERGKTVEERVKDVSKFWNTGELNPESNVQFGEGGAGTFSDGKLTTQVNNPRSKKILEYFVEAGAPEEILYYNKPHIGTDLLRGVVKNIRNRIISNGGEIKFGKKLTGLSILENKITGIVINNNEQIACDKLILALGHSARDTFEMLNDSGIKIEQKSFSIGVRIEHSQALINKNQYGESFMHPKLKPAEYKLSNHFDNGRSAYTFCMCPGGQVVAAASEEGMLVTNGMSKYSRKLETANSALLVGVGPDDFEGSHPLAGVEFQRKWERLAFIEGGMNYNAPAQKVGDFLKNKSSTSIGELDPSYLPGVKMTDISNCLPDYVVETLRKAIILFDKRIKGFGDESAIMTGVETRSSSPIRIKRDEDFQSNIKGIFPIGEGAGYAGGIMSSALDGLRIAEYLGFLKEEVK